MRKYYTPQAIKNRLSPRELDREICPWDVLIAYAKDVATALPWDILCRVVSIAYDKDPLAYIELSSYINSETQKYSESGVSVRTMFALRQVAMLLKKYPFENVTGLDPRKEAIKSLLAAEAQCSETNRRLRSLTTEELPRWVFGARELIFSVLGTLTPPLIMQMIKGGNHGPGSTLTSSRDRTTTYYKYADVPYSVTGSAGPYAKAAISSDPKWLEYLESTGYRSDLPPAGAPRFQIELMIMKDTVKQEDSDKITFVPKDCRTDRPIAIGAGLNVYLQLGVKALMEERLKRHGVDLTDQTWNQRLAMLGSRTVRGDNPNQFSTVDLASASDTISTELVKLLLPPDWFAFLDDLRHKSGRLDGQLIEYEKFCAMGNGFTFPLESLIFWAISVASIRSAGCSLQRGDIAVYGDDIIVRYGHTPHVLEALKWAGFTVNDEKSFLTGNFKESCGCDYFRGYDVRPFYLKRRIRYVSDLNFCSNWLAKKYLSSSHFIGLDATYAYLVGQIPPRARAYGPLLGDSGTELGRSKTSSKTTPVTANSIKLDIVEDFLQVPLAFMKERGIYPSLSEDEKGLLRRKGLLSEEDYNLQSFLVPRRLTVAQSFRAKQYVNYLIRLRTMSNTRINILGNAPGRGVDGGHATRRKATKRVIKVLPFHSWDGDANIHDRLRHPVWGLPRY